MQGPLLHIGYHRTGSTWLQRIVFGGPEPGGFICPWERDLIVRELILVDPFEFDADAARDAFAPGMKLALEESRVPVLSQERLSGSPFSGGFDSRPIAERLAAVFPEGRVLVVIRDQVDMIVSIWKRYVRVGGAASLRSFVRPPQTRKLDVPLFDFAHVDYARLVSCYQRLFGRANVLVLPFELLTEDPVGFVSSIAGFAGATPPKVADTRPRNVSQSALASALKRRLNLLLVRDAVNPAAPFDDARINRRLIAGFRSFDRVRFLRALRARWERRLREEAHEVVGDRYAESNRTLVELTGVELGRYGYRC